MQRFVSSIGNMDVILSVQPILTQKSTFQSKNLPFSNFNANQLFSTFLPMKIWKKTTTTKHFKSQNLHFFTIMLIKIFWGRYNIQKLYFRFFCPRKHDKTTLKVAYVLYQNCRNFQCFLYLLHIFEYSTVAEFPQFRNGVYEPLPDPRAIPFIVRLSGAAWR